MHPHPDQRYIDAIRRNDTAALRQMIAECYPPVEAWICRNNGTQDEARDMFGNALEAVCAKLHRGEHIELSASFSTYLFSICRFQWLKRLRRKKIDARVRLDDPGVLTLETDDLNHDDTASGLIAFVRRKLDKLGDSCRRLLELCWAEEKHSMDEIARLLGFASANYASKRKHECLEKLKQIIRSDPEVEDYF